MYKLIILVALLLGASVYLNTVISSSGEKKPESQVQSKAPNTGPLTEQMFNAVHAKAYKTMDRLLKKDPSLVNKIHAQGGTFINCAATAGDLQTLNYLLDHGANPDGNAKCGTNGLQIAVRNNNMEIVEALISRGANVNIFGEGDSTVLDLAAKTGKPSMVQYLIKNGAKYSKDLPKPAPKAIKLKNTKQIKANASKSAPKGW